MATGRLLATQGVSMVGMQRMSTGTAFQRRILATWLTLSLLLVAPGAVASDVLQPQWGAQQASIAADGPGQLVLDGARRVVRHTDVAGIPFTLNYRFEDDRLRQVRLFSRARHADPGRYIDDHFNLEAELTGIYGEPDVADAEWTDDQLMDRPEYHGQAVQVGFLTLVAGWEHADARVFLTLERQSFRPAQRLILTDPEVELR